MALMVIGFVIMTVLWFCWAVLWLVAAVCIALFWLAWPVMLLVFAAMAWRAQARRWPGGPQARTERPEAARSNQHSGNNAFDEYRSETLRRMDEERQKFSEFLEGLRKAKDREAFDRFMSERRGRPVPGLITQQ
jgi:hypothetical protein